MLPVKNILNFYWFEKDLWLPQIFMNPVELIWPDVQMIGELLGNFFHLEVLVSPECQKFLTRWKRVGEGVAKDNSCFVSHWLALPCL